MNSGERISGQLYIMNSEGDPLHDIDVPMGQQHIIEGTFGSVIIDTRRYPPKIQAKGNIVLDADEARGIRTTRTAPGQTVIIRLVDGFSTGKLTHQRGRTVSNDWE